MNMDSHSSSGQKMDSKWTLMVLLFAGCVNIQLFSNMFCHNNQQGVDVFTGCPQVAMKKKTYNAKPASWTVLNNQWHYFHFILHSSASLTVSYLHWSSPAGDCHGQHCHDIQYVTPWLKVTERPRQPQKQSWCDNCCRQLAAQLLMALHTLGPPTQVFSLIMPD